MVASFDWNDFVQNSDRKNASINVSNTLTAFYSSREKGISVKKRRPGHAWLNIAIRKESKLKDTLWLHCRRFPSDSAFRSEFVS